MDKGEVAGDLILDLPAALKPSGVTNFVIYWSSSSGTSGKGPKLAEVSSTLSGSVLYKVPENVSIPTGRGDYFLLYLKAANGQEVSSGKSTAVKDNFTVVDTPEETTTPEETVSEAPTQVEDTAPTEAAPTEEAPTTDSAAPVVVAPTTPSETPTTVDAPTEVKPTETPIVIDEPEVTVIATIVIKNVLFEFDKSYLRPEFKEQLRKDFADTENKLETRLLIAGHADERGSNEYNLALGERRAFAVKRYLISMGFTADNIRIISYGEEKPLDPGHNEIAWEKNRRSETDVIE